MSDSERPDLLALEELRRLLTTLGEEMIVLRRRAQQAEARVKELEEAESEPADAGTNGDRHAGALSRENEQLRARLRTARQRTQALLDKVRFLRQQMETGVER